MALSILFAQRSKAKFVGIKEIPLDASISENHTYQARVTSNPVEEGSDITDHVSITPVILNMTGFISDSPVKFLQGVQQLLSSTSGSGSISSSAHDDLLALFNTKQPFTVITGLIEHNSMIMRRLNFPRDANTGQALRFEAELIQVTFAKFQTENLNSDTLGDKFDSKDQAQTKADLGKQPAEVPTAAELEKTTFGYEAFKFLGLI